MPGFFGHKESIPEITPAEVQHRQAEGANLTLLDVREPQEYAEAHVAGSTMIPLGQLAFQLAKLPKDRPIVVLCRSGNRSGVAAQMLRRQGFTDVHNLRGGILAWMRAGQPVQRGR
jgi:rhodanese-related sulfurtransferase